MSHNTVPEARAGCDFYLRSGDYALTFDGEHVRIGRGGATEGLVFAILAERGIDALPHVRQQRMEQVQGRAVVTLLGEHDWAAFALTFDADPARPGLFHWRFAVTPHAAPPAPRAAPELTFTGAPQVTLYAQQAPMAAGLTYLYAGALLNSTLFYFQDLTALNGYFAASHTQPMNGTFHIPIPDSNLGSGIVGYKDGGLGLELPGAGLAALPVGATTVISDGYLALTPGRPADEPAMALRFLQDLAAVYGRISRPQTDLVDWRALARHTLADLPDPRNWVQISGQPFLRAYVNDERTTAELITQLDVLTSLRDYHACYGDASPGAHLADRLAATLPYFFNPEARAMLNQPLAVRQEADSWYFVTALVDLARLTQGDARTPSSSDPLARRLLMDSVERAIEIARRYNYVFPIFFDPARDRHPDQPRLHPPCEYDVAPLLAVGM